jgi:hypothetical protein
MSKQETLEEIDVIDFGAEKSKKKKDKKEKDAKEGKEKKEKKDKDTKDDKEAKDKKDAKDAKDSKDQKEGSNRLLPIEEKKPKKEGDGKTIEEEKPSKKESKLEMKEGGDGIEGGDEDDTQVSQKRQELKFEDPYSYEFLLERVNNIIKKNNTFTSSLILTSFEQGLRIEAYHDRACSQAKVLLDQVQRLL